RRAQVVEEGADLLPDLAASSQAAPVPADAADQRVAGVDRDPVVLVDPAPAADEERLGIVLQAARAGEAGVLGLDACPGVERQEGLRGPRRARVHGHDALVARASEEERELDRDPER